MIILKKSSVANYQQDLEEEATRNVESQDQMLLQLHRTSKRRHLQCAVAKQSAKQTSFAAVASLHD